MKRRDFLKGVGGTSLLGFVPSVAVGTLQEIEEVEKVTPVEEVIKDTAREEWKVLLRLCGKVRPADFVALDPNLISESSAEYGLIIAQQHETEIVKEIAVCTRIDTHSNGETTFSIVPADSVTFDLAETIREDQEFYPERLMVEINLEQFYFLGPCGSFIKQLPAPLPTRYMGSFDMLTFAWNDSPNGMLSFS